MDYSVNPWWVYVISVVGLLFVIIGLPILGVVSSSRRTKRQSLSIKNGNVYILDSAFGGQKVVPVERIGTVVYLPEREPPGAYSEDAFKARARSLGNGANLFTYGGLIVLDAEGVMVGHLAYEVGSDAPLGTVWKQIPATSYVQVPPKKSGAGYSRAAFKRAFPRALRFGQLWGATRWIWTIVGFIVIGIPMLVFIGAVIWALVTTLAERNG